VDQTGRTSAWVSLAGAGAHFRAALPPAALAFTQQPTNSAAGAALTPAVRVAVQDAVGTTLASFTGNVTIALTNNTTGAALQGTATVAAVAGVATFTDLSVDRAGTGYTLTATVGALQHTSAGFNVSSAAADLMQLSTLPASITAGVNIAPAPTVTVRDALGNVATGFTGNISLSFAPNADNVVLVGTLSVAAVAGVATFSDVRAERTATALTVLATATGLANVTSAPLAVRS
jgi:hypothetical protein